MKKLSVLFTVLTLLVSHLTCAFVAYNYCELQWCGQYGGCSAPPSTAFVAAIPAYIAIAVTATLAIVFHKKSKKQP